jgi:hypothetical protein
MKWSASPTAVRHVAGQPVPADFRHEITADEGTERSIGGHDADDAPSRSLQKGRSLTPIEESDRPVFRVRQERTLQRHVPRAMNTTAGKRCCLPTGIGEGFAFGSVEGMLRCRPEYPARLPVEPARLSFTDVPLLPASDFVHLNKVRFRLC